MENENFVIVNTKMGVIIQPSDVYDLVDARLTDRAMARILDNECDAVDVIGVSYDVGRILLAIDPLRLDQLRQKQVEDINSDILDGISHPEVGIECVAKPEGVPPWEQEVE